MQFVTAKSDWVFNFLSVALYIGNRAIKQQFICKKVLKVFYCLGLLFPSRKVSYI